MFCIVKITNGEPSGWVIAASREELVRLAEGHGDRLLVAYLKSHFDDQPGKHWIAPDYWLLIY